MTVDQDRRHDSRGKGGEASLWMKTGGMSCSFCTNTIRRAYGRIEGVHEVGVSLAHEEGLVKYQWWCGSAGSGAAAPRCFPAASTRVAWGWAAVMVAVTAAHRVVTGYRLLR